MSKWNVKKGKREREMSVCNQANWIEIVKCVCWRYGIINISGVALHSHRCSLSAERAEAKTKTSIRKTRKSQILTLSSLQASWGFFWRNSQLISTQLAFYLAEAEETTTMEKRPLRLIVYCGQSKSFYRTHIKSIAPINQYQIREAD